MGFFWFWIGGVCAFLMVGMAADAVKHKTPLREWLPTAAGGAAVLVGGWALLYLTVSWVVEQTGWGSFLAVIGFLYLAFVLGCALVGGLLRALYRS